MKIISGGQTGVDRAALEVAQELGIRTGGWCPKGWLTENGPDPTLRDFGLQEHSSSQYPPRTIANVRLGDGTVWFGATGSSGYMCTEKAIAVMQKPAMCNPTVEGLRWWIKKHKIEVLNVAGTRGSRDKDGSAAKLCKDTLCGALKEVPDASKKVSVTATVEDR